LKGEIEEMHGGLLLFWVNEILNEVDIESGCGIFVRSISGIYPGAVARCLFIS
jgi:hypothetical protein